jgi:phosphate transport system substrate-binding protein
VRARALAVLALSLGAAAGGSVTPVAPGAAAATISISGSSTALPVVADLAYFYRRSHRDAPRFSLVGGGTAAGITDTARGVVDAGVVSRALAASDPPGLVATTFALSGVCLVTNRSNALPGLSRAEIQDLVSGRVTTWAQVPGSTRTDAIVAAGLIPGTGARTVFISTFLDPATPLAYHPRTFSTADDVREFVLSTPAAWGYVDLRYTDGLRTVPYEGHPCARAAIRARAYPATRPLAVITRGAPRGAVARFLRWIRTSRVARDVIATRYLPAS